MISDSLKELIISQLRLHLDKNDWRYIDLMFSEAYKTNVEGFDIITLKPQPNADDIAMQFYAFNGAYFEITSWDYIKRIGEKL